MIEHIVCPHQEAETFSFDVCWQCSSYDHTINGAKFNTPKCRKQKTKEHKRGFEGAYLSYYLGYPFTIAIDGPEDPKK